MVNSKKKLPIHRKVYIAPSKIEGYGIFAKQDFKPGQTVYIIKGRIIKFNIRNERDALYGPLWIGIGKNTWIDTRGVAPYLNHSSNPNCGIRGRVTVCAMRPIKKGEEITIDYSITEEQPLWWMKDATAKNKKESIIRAIQFMPKEKFKRYLPYIPRYFQSVYRKHHKLA